MTVAQLIEVLKLQDPTAIVLYYNSVRMEYQTPKSVVQQNISQYRDGYILINVQEEGLKVVELY